jgi:hypothetical protein
MKEKEFKKDVVDFSDLANLTSKGRAAVKKATGLDLSVADALTIIKIGVFEYGFQCVLHGSPFKLRRLGTFKHKDCSKRQDNLKEFFAEKKANKLAAKVDRQKQEATKKNIAKVIDLSYNSSIFASLNFKLDIINDNSRYWNGNFGRAECSPPIDKMGDVLYSE